ncbi:uncharacterized protein LOC129953958 [Eupeodes corollae]|uniref:uncharacterized protein LOC129953958 n=1 Tax=Eupeodes corollae TaxID=290404 RepID=UPI0024923564|nr:uncharacterized protein LOC129953958 [Eupeodes corollae]
MIVTSYDAFLQALMTEPPREIYIRSFEDLAAANLKINVRSTDIDFIFHLNPELKRTYSEVFHIENSSEKFDRERDAFNTKYAFIVSNTKWDVYENLQNFLGRKLFRWSKELCPMNNLRWGFPINENSMYKEIINNHILETQSAGLWDYWRKRMFYELIDIGKIKLKGFETQQIMRQMKIEDFKLIWIGMGVAFVVSSSCCVAEICVFKFKN